MQKDRPETLAYQLEIPATPSWLLYFRTRQESYAIRWARSTLKEKGQRHGVLYRIRAMDDQTGRVKVCDIATEYDSD